MPNELDPPNGSATVFNCPISVALTEVGVTEIRSRLSSSVIPYSIVAANIWAGKSIAAPNSRKNFRRFENIYPPSCYDFLLNDIRAGAASCQL
jgi:hypothetical protein